MQPSLQIVQTAYGPLPRRGAPVSGPTRGAFRSCRCRLRLAENSPLDCFPGAPNPTFRGEKDEVCGAAVWYGRCLDPRPPLKGEGDRRSGGEVCHWLRPQARNLSVACGRHRAAARSPLKTVHWTVFRALRTPFRGDRGVARCRGILNDQDQ